MLDGLVRAKARRIDQLIAAGLPTIQHSLFFATESRSGAGADTRQKESPARVGAPG